MQLKTLARLATVAAVATASAVAVSAAAFVAFVTPDTLTQTGWSAVRTPGASLRFLDAGDVPGLASSAAELAVNKGEAGAWLRLTDPMWTMPLDQLGGIDYRMLVTGKCKKNGQAGHAIYVAFDIDTDGDHVADDVLVFDPAADGGVICEQWQNWSFNKFAQQPKALWYWASDKHGAKDPAPLSAYLAEHPDADIIFGGIRLVAGLGKGSWKDFVGYVDAFTITRFIPCDPNVPFCLPGPQGTYDFGRTSPF